MPNHYDDPSGDYNEHDHSDGTYDSDYSDSDVEGAHEAYKVKHGTVYNSNSYKKSGSEMEVVFGTVEMGKDYDDSDSEKTKKPNAILEWMKQHKYISIGSGVGAILLILIIALSVGLSGKSKASSSAAPAKAPVDQQKATPIDVLPESTPSNITEAPDITTSTEGPTDRDTGTLFPIFDGVFEGFDDDDNSTIVPTEFGSKTWLDSDPLIGDAGEDDAFSGTWWPTTAQWWKTGFESNETSTDVLETMEDPTDSPTESPTKSPTKFPTAAPQEQHSEGLLGFDHTPSPTVSPTQIPTVDPTKFPTREPLTQSPTGRPTLKPTQNPTWSPIYWPTAEVTTWPTWSPTTFLPTVSPEPTIDWPFFFPQPENQAVVGEAQLEGQENVNKDDGGLMRKRQLEAEIGATGNISHRRERWSSRMK